MIKSPYFFCYSLFVNDPLSEVIRLMRPKDVFSKVISGSGAWAVQYATFGWPSFCTVLEGGCRLILEGQEPITMERDDFLLLSETPAFTMSGFEPAQPKIMSPDLAMNVQEEVRHGDSNRETNVRLLGGFFTFESPDRSMLSMLLPKVVHIKSAPRVSSMVRLIREETTNDLAGKDLMLKHLVEILLVEALRSSQSLSFPGLLKGLEDQRLREPIREFHRDPSQSWTVSDLAKIATLSRSAFFERFMQKVGIAPMEYIFAWRMALATDLLRKNELSLEEIAMRVGYSSAGAFSNAFSRHLGQSPRRYAKSLP